MSKQFPIILMVLMALVGSYLLLVRGPRAENATLKEERAQIKEEEAGAAQEAEGDAREAEVTADRKTAKAARAAIPPDISVKEIRELVEAAADESGVQSSDTSPVDDAPRSAAVTATGTTMALSEMVTALATMVRYNKDLQLRANGPLLLIEGLSITPVPESEDAKAAFTVKVPAVE